GRRGCGQTGWWLAMFEFVVILKGLNEVALMALLGQGALFILAGSRRETNIVYSMLKTVTSPLMKATRWIAPRFIVDQHIGFLTLFFLLVIEAVLIVFKVRLYYAAVAAG
ncbi:MAG TPA: hypothetical protein VEW70_20415, partial [Burkholderiales bacterium]|nr:hypothetical protein [Burkholderiales bacterium]